MTSMPPLDWVNGQVTDLRAGYAAERRGILDQCAPDVLIEDHAFCTGPGLVFVPLSASGTDILYFHGGGWIVGSPWTHRTLCSWLAHLTGRRVYAAPYTLAPEAQFPSQAKEATALAAEFSETRDRIILCGDSAGAAMALWGEQGCDTVAATVALYGAFGCLDTDALMGTDSDELGPDALMSMYRHLMGHADTGPLQAQIAPSGPPVLAVKAGLDPLRDDVDWLKGHRSAVTVIEAPNHDHAFLQFCGSDRAARRVMARIAEWISNY